MKLFTVGPVEMFDEVKAIRADKDSVPYFRTKEFSELPLNKNDDIIWRGKLSKNYLEQNNGIANRLGDVSVTFTIL